MQLLVQVPLSELLEEPEETVLSEGVRQRACLLRIAKTAKTLASKCSASGERQLATEVVNLLEELMPELKEIGTLPEGRPCSTTELGRAGQEINIMDWMLTPHLD